jgi:hypothetical protein
VISIFAAAFAAIEATLPNDSEADGRPDGKGGYLVTLGLGVLGVRGSVARPAVGATRRPFCFDPRE